MEKQNVTIGTTFIKWMWHDAGKMGVFGACLLIHVFIFLHFAEYFLDMPIWASVSVTTIFDIGSTLILVSSLIKWFHDKHRANKL